MHTKLARLLETMKPGKRGIHGTANCYSTAEYYERQFGEWVECGLSWVKLLAASDSQVETVRRMRAKNLPIIPIVRFWYGNNSYPVATISPDQIKPYVDQGVLLFEPINEPYLEWNGTMPADWPSVLAREWAVMASAILTAGGVPLTPSIESWRFGDIFMPLIDVLLRDYRSVLAQSVLAGHWRTLNHPVLYASDPGGYRGWEDMDAYVAASLGEHLPLISTEAGPEVGWDQDKNFPRVTVPLHTAMCMDIWRYPTPAHYLADCFWLWEDTGTFRAASWKRNGIHYGGRDLPVVEAFKTTRPDVPVPELTDEYIRTAGRLYPSAVSLNPDAALFKAAMAAMLGQAETSEWSQDGWVWQKFEGGVVAVPQGQWDRVRVVKWPE